MKTVKRYYIKNEHGEFYGFGKWHTEFPEAELFETSGEAFRVQFETGPGAGRVRLRWPFSTTLWEEWVTA